MCTMSLDLLTKTEIFLSGEEYNATKSRIRFHLLPIDSNKWTQISNDIGLSIVSRLFITASVQSMREGNNLMLVHLSVYRGTPSGLHLGGTPSRLHPGGGVSHPAFTWRYPIQLDGATHLSSGLGYPASHWLDGVSTLAKET